MGGVQVTYSYTQISQYLTCPRRYRHHYLDGWQENDTRRAAALMSDLVTYVEAVLLKSGAV
jgi:PD-(D/E)XK nuclease superfamily